MRAMGLLSFVLIAAACLPQPQSIAPTPSPSPSPVPTETPTASPAPTPSPTATPTGAAPTAVRFADPLRGWLGTDDGILGTTNADATWDRQLTSGSITKLWSYDATHAWALAGLSDLYRTVDGTHWLPAVRTA